MRVRALLLHHRVWSLCALLLFALTVPFSGRCAAQSIDLEGTTLSSANHSQRVTFFPEPMLVRPNQPEWIDLRFRVAPGFHVNSHTPGDETLIPTSLQLGESPQYRVLKQVYPPGTPLRLAIGAGQVLSTYQGEFRIRLQIVAAKDNGIVAGSLHYQACNAASCFPPRELPFSVPLSTR